MVALDVGTVRVGVAASDESGTIATPRWSLLRQPEDRFWELLQKEVRLLDAQHLVVGLPRQMDGTEGKAAVAAREFAQEAEKRLGTAVELWDERLTTVAAERSLIEQGVRRKQRRTHIDAVAAALLLQNWLDARPRVSP